MSPKRGREEIPLDLSEVPTVEAGLEKAKELDRVFRNLAKGSWGPPTADEPPITGRDLYIEHLPYWSFINRAVSLHRGIVGAIEQENPHATFTLMRAYLELVILVHYVNGHYEYLNVLTNPPETLPKGQGRKKYAVLIDAAAKDMRGIWTVYERLSDWSHFSATSMWAPFQLEEDRHLRYGTPPHWKRPDDARIAVAMLLENDRHIIDLLATFARVHVWPWVNPAAAPEAGEETPD